MLPPLFRHYRGPVTRCLSRENGTIAEALEKMSPESEAHFMAASRAQAEHELFLARFMNWRVSMLGAIGLGLLIGGMYYYVTRATALFEWMTLHVTAYAAIGAMCWHYQRRRPVAGSNEQKRWLRAWTAAAGIAGFITGSLPWWLPADNAGSVLSASVIVSIAIIAFVASRGHRPIIYATVIGQTAAVSLALALHARVPLAVPISLLFACFVLAFGLLLNRAMLNAIAQRLYAQHLSAELAETHRKELQVQQLEAALRERRRMMEDMHDGLGSSLLSSLILLENGRLSVDGAAAVMRECVDDLRLIVDSQEPAAQDLSTLVGMLRYRLQHRIHAAGIDLRWRMDELPDQPWLNPSQSLDLLRILQEAIANALKHAQASEIEFSTRRADAHVELVIRDNGRGFDAGAGSQSGHGLRGMRVRATRLGAVMRVESEKGAGTQVVLQLPMPACTANTGHATAQSADLTTPGAATLAS
jgi:signal transduction histidine kinase